jgi:ribose 5-phosphate isomerase B
MDLGPTDEQSEIYPDYAIPVAQAVAAGKCSSGVLICGAAWHEHHRQQGKGIRAALCVPANTPPWRAAPRRQHSGAAGRFIAPPTPG